MYTVHVNVHVHVCYKVDLYKGTSCMTMLYPRDITLVANITCMTVAGGKTKIIPFIIGLI